VEVHLSPTGRGLTPGGIAAFVVRANASEGSATFVVKSVSMTDVVVTEQCPRLCLPPQELELLPLSEAQLAAQAIGSRWRDPVYEEALSSAVDVLTILGE